MVKGSDPVAIFKKLKETYDADTTAVFFEVMEKIFDPQCEEDLFHFLNRKYKELNDFEDFGKTSKVEDGVTTEETPHKISETVKVLMVFAIARKVQKYAIELDDFVTENLVNLSFDSSDLKFATLYEKFLRNREITGVSKKTVTGDPRDPVVFSTEVFHSELNKALQRRENNRRQGDFKKKKLLKRNHNRNFDRGHPEVQKPGRGIPPKRKVWHCNVHGNQTDHTTEWCHICLARRDYEYCSRL